MATNDIIANIGIPSVNWGPILSYVTWGFILIAILMVAAWFYYPKTWPIQLIIRRRTGGGEIHLTDDAIIKDDEGTKKLYSNTLKMYAPKPNSSHFIPSRGLFKKWAIYMHLDDNGNLVPLDFIDEEYRKSLVPRQLDMEQWAQLERKRIRTKYDDDFWAKYGVIVAQGMVAAALIIGIIMLGNKYVEGQEIFAQAANTLATVIQARG